MTRRSGMKRTLMRLALFMVGGAMLNVAVAWGCAWRVQFDIAHPSRAGRDIIGAYTVTFFECQTTGATGVVANLWNDPLSANAMIFPAGSMPSWAAAQVTTFGIALDGYPMDASGFPFRSLGCKWMDNWTLRDGIALSKDQYAWAASTGDARSALPLRPIWPGFAINTLFYACILWLLFTAPGFARRRIRRKRGLCPHCAYPIGTSALCTECGKPVTH